MAFAGFSRTVRYTPVPNPLMGPLLEQIDDLGELKCTLRVIWHLHQKRGSPRYVTLSELLADGSLARALIDSVLDSEAAVVVALDRAVRRGTLVTAATKGNGTGERLYALNTLGARRTLADISPSPDELPTAEPVKAGSRRPNVFSLYEDNIGMLSPMITDQLKEAEESYPDSWIEDAMREAVENNKRSWRYIAAILERWEREGRSDGGAGRHTQKAGYGEYFRR